MFCGRAKRLGIRELSVYFGEIKRVAKIGI
jgi:hypothetical protein